MWPSGYLTPRPLYAGQIIKRRFRSKNASNVFSQHYAGEIWKCNYHRRQKRLSTLLSIEVYQHDVISKSFVIKMFSVHIIKRRAGVFKFVRFGKGYVFGGQFTRISVHGTPNREIKLRFQI